MASSRPAYTRSFPPRLERELRQETADPDARLAPPCRKSIAVAYWGSSGSGGALCGGLRGLAALS